MTQTLTSIAHQITPRPLHELVKVRARYARSVHLARDWKDGLGADYHLTPSALDTLRSLHTAWDRPTDRALTLVGPYGSGKSAFALFLASLLRGDPFAMQLLRAEAPDLADFFAPSSNRLFPVALVGSRQALAPALGRGLVQALKNDFAPLARELERDLEASDFAPRALADAYQLAARRVVERGFGGLILLGDELGKWLEWAALHPGEGDIFVLQELAEAAARSGTLQSGGAPLWILAVLHQNAEAYAGRLGRVHQAEWAKVGERFREVPFFPSDAERLEMTGWALEHAPDLHLNGSFEHLAARGPALVPQTLSGSLARRFAPLAQAAYPLHPLVLLLLPPLFRKSGQSHRSLWNFLSGQESHALGRFLREATFGPQTPLFGTDALFDYASETLLGGWSAGHLTRLWAEASEAVERAHSLSPLALRVLKTIALLGLLRDAHLIASPALLEWALSDTDQNAPDLRFAFDELLERRLISWSRARGCYRLYEGGDVDVEAALEAARAAQSGDTALRAALQLCPPPQLLARRHSFLTGTLRAVASRPCQASELPALLQTDELSVFFCLYDDAVAAQSAVETAQNAPKPNVLIAIARQSEVLREAARELAGAGEVEKHTPALQGDRAARRELSARRFEAQSAFIAEWNRLFGPDAPDARWFYGGEEKTFASSRDFSAFLSYLADQTYPETPILRNELLNRHELSSAAAAGRRALVEAMLLHPGEERLALEGFPPEVSMYECLLHAPGLHQETAPGVWKFGPPPNNEACLEGVWRVMEEEIFAEPPAPRPLTQLWEKLAAPPFGLSDGVMPPLLLAFLQSYPNETTLYRDGSWLAEPGVADWEILLRRPEHFAVAGSRIKGDRVAIVQRLARAFGVEPFAVPVAAALVKNARRLSDHARQTSRLPETTKALRRTLESGSSPEKLLFSDLPQAVGVDNLFSETASNNVEVFFAALVEALQAWNAATPQLIERARDTLLEACSLTPDESGWESLRREAAVLQGGLLETKLVPFINRASATGDGATVLDSVLALIANRSPKVWSDNDEDRFVLQARVYGDLFQAARFPKAEIQQAEVPPVQKRNPVPATKLGPLTLHNDSHDHKLVEELRVTLSRQMNVSRAAQIAALRSLLQEMEALEDG